MFYVSCARKITNNHLLFYFQLSLADIQLFNFVDAVKLAGMGEVWKGCDSIQKHYDLIKANPKIAAWLSKRPPSEF